MNAELRCQINDDIELRRLEPADALDLFGLVEANREHLRQWLPWLDGTRSVDDVVAFIDARAEQFNEGKGSHAGIRYRGTLCGVIGMHTIDAFNRSTSIGYWLDAAHQGRGIMTAACQAVVTHAFTTLDLHRVAIRCATENRRSRAIPERLGFSLEGVARDGEWLYDHFVDLAVYSKLRSDA